jgi:copper chaperone
MATATLKVTGMTCQHCVKAVREALESVAGVRSAEVDLTAGRAVVEFDEGGTTDPAQLASAVQEEGYGAETIS